MAEEDRYLNNAIAGLELAQAARSKDAEDRSLRLADLWRRLAEQARRDARRSREPIKLRRPFRRGRKDLNRDAMLVEIGKQLRAEYAASEEPLPERLTALVEQLERRAA